jgi:hypothetical protein
MDQSVVRTAPTTSACAAIASMVLAAVSNMRMGWSPAGIVPGRVHIRVALLRRNKRAQQSCLHAMQSCRAG